MVLAGLGAVVIAWSTLRPHAAAATSAATACCSAYDIILNILLFVPLGVGLALGGLSPRAAMMSGALASVAIEAAQLLWIPGRFASGFDVAANSTGTVLGVLVVLEWASRARWWPKLAIGIAPTIVLLWLLGGQVAQPAIPGPTPWRVERPAVPIASQRPPGRVLDASLQGFDLPDGPIRDLPALRALLSASDTVRLVATMVTGGPASGLRRLMEVVVGEGTMPFLVLAEEDGKLLAYERLGLSWVGLRGPWLSVPGMLSGAAGDTVHIRLEATRREVRLVVARGGERRTSVQRLSPDLYLSALFNRATDGVLWWRLVPAGCSLLFLGLALATRPTLLVAGSGLALFLSARAGGTAYPGWPVLVAAVGGAWLGRWSAQALRLFGTG